MQKKPKTLLDSSKRNQRPQNKVEKIKASSILALDYTGRQTETPLVSIVVHHVGMLRNKSCLREEKKLRFICFFLYVARSVFYCVIGLHLSAI